MYVSFIHILLPQFLTYRLVNILLFEICCLSVCLRRLSAGVRDDCWYLWIIEGFRCIDHYVCLIYMAVDPGPTLKEG